MGVVFYLLIVLATQWLCLPKRVICVVCLVYFYLKSEMNALDLISNYINDGSGGATIFETLSYLNWEFAII